MNTDPSYLQADQYMETDHPLVTSLVEKLTKGTPKEAERARILFEYVRDQIAYTIYVPFWLPEHYRATTILERGTGYCVQKSIVLCTLARAAGIPARLVFADIRNQRIPEILKQAMGSDRFVYHSYTDLYLGGRWLQATPSFDDKTSAKHGFPLVEFDGQQSAILPPEDSQGRPFVEYLESHGTFASLPLDQIMSAWDETYGTDRIAMWRKAFAAAPATEQNLDLDQIPKL